MSDSYIKTYKYDNGEIQRVQVVTADSFDRLQFMFPAGSPKAFAKIVNLYRNFIVPRCPWIFGRMVLYYVPENLKAEFARETGITATMSDDAKICEFLRRTVKIRNAKPVYSDNAARKICTKMIEEGYFEVVCGKLPTTKFLPVGNSLGFLSENMPDAKVKVNSNFFVMDCFDVASTADRIGAPIGLMVKNGEVMNPPLYDREAFLVHSDGSVEIRKVKLNELSFKITRNEKTDDRDVRDELKPGVNAELYTRPSMCRIPKSKKGLFAVIVGCRVEAVCTRGGFEVPTSGFVLEIGKDEHISVGDTVVYKGLEDISFGVQVGNSIIVNGRKTTGFISDFYNIRRQFGMRAYPPSLYPLDYEKARAPRIAIGVMKDGKPCILWAEGPKKSGYVPGEQSCGASLGEMADIAADLGIVSAVNLDGGGSAQILTDNKRALTISDRNPDDSDAERAIPAGIYIM